MEVFCPWTLHYFEFFYFFFIALCTMMPYDAPSTQKINRKWACSAKTASKWRFFFPGLYNVLKFFIFFVHTPLDHRALRYTVNVVTTTKPEVGVERQNSVKMEVFRPWTLHFFETFYFFFHRALHHHALRCTIDAVAKIKPEVGVARQNSVNGCFSSLEIFYFHRALHHHALRYTVHTVTKIKPEVGVQCHNSVKMAVFRPWTLHFFEILKFFFS